MIDLDKEFKKVKKSPIYCYEYYKLSISEYFFCLKCRIFKQCYKCNYYNKYLNNCIKQYYNEDDSPKKCHYCDCKDFYGDTKSIVQNTVAEYSIHCKKCDKQISYWAYGSYQPINLGRMDSRKLNY